MDPHGVFRIEQRIFVLTSGIDNLEIVGYPGVDDLFRVRGFDRGVVGVGEGVWGDVLGR